MIIVRFQVHIGCLTLEIYLPTRVNSNPLGIYSSFGLSTHPAYCAHALQIKSKSFGKPIYKWIEEIISQSPTENQKIPQLIKPAKKRKN
jgi:hypothetical protein